MWFWREEHNTRPTPIDYAPGTVILADIVKIMPALLTRWQESSNEVYNIIYKAHILV